jgi:hypothetical protein
VTRLGRVLDQATLNYLGPRDIDAGNSTLIAGDLGTDSALEYMLNIVEQSEQGLMSSWRVMGRLRFGNGCCLRCRIRCVLVTRVFRSRRLRLNTVRRIWSIKRL